MKPYSFKFFHREKINDGTLISRDTYRFKTRYDRVYFVEIETYVDNVYIAKFYLRIHKNLKNKYKFVINDGDGFRILSTCIQIAKKINDDDNIASFGFIGESCIGESTIKTKRYRIYSMIAAKYFSPNKYNHIRDEETSIYFLLNKLNEKVSLKEIEKKLNSYYILP